MLTHEEAAQPRCQAMGCRRLVGKQRNKLRTAPPAPSCRGSYLYAVVVLRGQLAELAIL